MKLYPFILILFYNYSFAQNVDFTGKVEYTMYLNFDKVQEYKAELFFNDSISLFRYKNKNETFQLEEVDYDYSQGIKSQTFITDTATYTVIFKKKENVLFGKQRDIGSKEFYYTYEKIPKLKWDLLPDKKNIQDIECNLAKTFFRGRTYYAWYAPSIPNNYGPWKLNGLPGLIVEAYDETKEVIFNLKSIKIPYNGCLELINPNFPILTLKEHVKKQNNIDSRIGSKIQSKFGRGITVKVKTEIKRIELEYDDL